jgi:hypothetical protein
VSGRDHAALSSALRAESGPRLVVASVEGES